MVRVPLKWKVWSVIVHSSKVSEHVLPSCTDRCHRLSGFEQEIQKRNKAKYLLLGEFNPEY